MERIPGTGARGVMGVFEREMEDGGDLDSG